MSSSNSSILHRPPLAPALSSHTIPRTSSNHSLPSINIQSRPHTPKHQHGSESHGAAFIPTSDTGFTTPSPSFKVTSDRSRSPRGIGNISPPVLQSSSSNPSLRSAASLRPSISIPSMRNGCDPIATPPGSNRQWSRTHCPSPSAPPSPSPWTSSSQYAASPSSSKPPSVLVKTKSGSPPPVMLHEGSRSTSDTWAPSGLRTSTSMGGIGQTPAPRLQRKKSNASLLVSGIGRGLGRVGSVMRRNNNSGSDANGQAKSGATGGSNRSGPSGSGVGGAQTHQSYPSQTWGSGRPRMRRVGSTQLQDLCEDNENEGRAGGKAPAAVQQRPQQSMDGSLRGRKSGDDMPPGWTRVTTPSTPPTQSPSQSPAPVLMASERESGVSRPFNVQHELHVAADLEGLPSHWINQLKAQGLSEADLFLITAAQKRQRAVTRTKIEHLPIQPPPPVIPIAQVEPPTPERGTFATKSQATSKHHKLQAMQRRLSRFNPSVNEIPPVPPVRPATVVIPNDLPPTVVIPPTSPEIPRPAETLVLAPATTVPVAARPAQPTPPAPSATAPTSPAARPKMPRRSASAETAATIATVGSVGGATGIYRKPSIISKLLDDLDSVSAHPSRPQQLVNATLRPPSARADASDSEAESLRSSRPPSPCFSSPSSHRYPHKGRSRNVSATSAQHPAESKRLSEELRGFRDLNLNDEDGWASSVLAAWDGDNSISMTRTRTASPAPPAVLVTQRVPEKVVGSPSHQPPEAAGFGLAHTPPSKPQSLRSIRRTPSPLPMAPTIGAAGTRRRSRSFDFDPALRATLYSPPPPPPHPHRKHNPTFHSVHGSFSLSAAPIIEKRRKSIDSFGNHPDDDEESAESCYSKSPSGSELDLGTPPLEAEPPSTVQTRPPRVSAMPKRRSEPDSPPMSVLPPRHSSLAHSVPESTCAPTTEESVVHSETPVSITLADLNNFPSIPTSVPSVPSTGGHRSDHFSFPASAVSHSQTSHGTPPGVTRPQSPDSDSDFPYSFSHNVPPTSSALGLCLSLGEPSSSSHHSSSNSVSHSYPYGSHVRPPSYSYNYIGPTRVGHSRNESIGAHIPGHGHTLAASFSPNPNASLMRSGSNTRNSKMSDDMRLTDNRNSTLSRMSSVASSIHSYNVHEATVHRAYTRVLRRVNEVSREGAETPPVEDVGIVDVHNAENAMGALEDAAWRVHLRERVATN